MTPAKIDALLIRFADIDIAEQPRVLMWAFYKAMMTAEHMGGPDLADAFFWFRDGWRARDRATAADFQRAATSG
jgi:hypothetical protein